MLRFQEPSHLFAFVLIPLLVLLFLAYLGWRRRTRQSMGDPERVARQFQGKIPGRRTLRFVLYLSSLCLLIVGWANLQMGMGAEKVERRGVDVIFALDVSNSMEARDISPDRLTRAKQVIGRVMDKLDGDRVGFVIFAGRAYLQVPLTVDYGALRMMLSHANPSQVQAQGTVISEAISMARTSFSQKEKKYKTLIVITDGEDHDPASMQEVNKAVQEGVLIHTVGVGSSEGTTLYDRQTGQVKRDKEGNPVISRLNEAALKELAARGGGMYFPLANPERTADDLVAQINEMEERSLGSVVFTDYKSYFQYFLLPGFLLLCLEQVIPGARRRKFKSQNQSS